MHLAAVFTRKLALMPFDLANPVWIHDDDIDLDYHVRYMVLPKPGTIEQLEALRARLHSMLLDRSRPLWEFYIIEGLADGRIGFYGKVHHAAVDGQAGGGAGDQPFRRDARAAPRQAAARRSRANTYQLGVAELLGRRAHQPGAAGVEFAALMPPLAGDSRRRGAKPRWRRGSRERGAQGRKAPTRFKLAPAHAVQPPDHQPARVRRASRCRCRRSRRSARRSARRSTTWCCGCAARRCAATCRQPRAAGEVARRRRADLAARRRATRPRNNQVAGTLIDLGTQTKPIRRAAKAINAARAAMKKQMGTFGGVIPTDFPSLGSPWLISGLASLYGRSRIADWLRVANVTISNVPGSQVPVYLAGAKMTDYYPLSIVVHGVALNITVQSHVDNSASA